jgi:hypothetical protein
MEKKYNRTKPSRLKKYKRLKDYLVSANQSFSPASHFVVDNTNHIRSLSAVILYNARVFSFKLLESHIAYLRI